MKRTSIYVQQAFCVFNFRGAGKPGKLNVQIFMYRKHFVCLIFAGRHNPQKYFNMKILCTKNSDLKIPQITVSPCTLTIPKVLPEHNSSQ